MNHSKILIEGFDIFDTVLTRKVSPPEAVFHQLGRCLAGKYGQTFSAEFFATQRRQAEARCMMYFRRSTSIHNIYDELADTLSLSEELRGQLLNEELQYEKQLTYVVPETAVLLQQAREHGRKIVFISDMYLPEHMLRELLGHHGILQENDSVYVSCDVGVEKGSGELYSWVLKSEGVIPAQFLFHGNSLHSDVIQARRRGIQAHHHTSANANLFETVFGRFSDSTAGFSGKFAGASRYARLHVVADSVHEQSIRDVAAGVAAPLLVSFVIWLMNKASALGLNRLYFLSRDGQILLEIAKVVREKLSLDIECRYLYSSRASWNRYSNSEKVQGWIWSDMESTTTLQEILSRMDIAYGDVSEDLAGIGFAPESLHTPLTAETTVALRKLWASTRFQAKMAQLGSVNKDTLDDFFRQELLYDSAAKGIVDSGWLGTLHESLSGFVANNGAPPVHGFFYGLPWSVSEKSDFRHSFHLDLTRGLGPLSPLPRQGMFCAVEVFCAADHGTVYGFARTDSGVSPLLEQGWPGHVVEWGLQLYRETVMSFVAALEIDQADAEQIAVMRPANDRALQLFWLNPGLAEAQAWGSYPWDAGQGNEKLITPLAEPVTFIQLARLILFRNKLAALHENSWFEGSLRLSSPAVRQLYRGLLLGKKIMRKLYKLARG